jgi:hypothetical protein
MSASRVIQPDVDLLERFEHAWQSGDPPSIGDFLPPVDEPLSADERLTLLCELVAIDLWYRWCGKEASGRAGELPQRPVLDDYRRRHPELGPLEGLPATLVREEYRVRRLQG